MPVKVFISYKYQDKGRNQWVEKLYKDLRDAGIEAKHEKYEVAPGDSFSDYMTSEISQCDYVLFIVTPNAVEAVESGKGALAFEMEISNARRMSGKDDFRIIPIFREGDRTSVYLSDHRYIDFRNDAEYESSLNELLMWLKGEVKAPALGSSDNFFSVNQASHSIILLDAATSKKKAAQLSSVYRHLTSLGLNGKKIVRLHWAADSPPLTHKYGREIDDPYALNERALYSEAWDGPLDDGLLFW
ncbi:MAG: toll/interleukin-1 receptor domain-containing protein, partial [Anaerolineales bacterium]